MNAYDLLEQRIPRLMERFRAGLLEDACCAALYFLVWQIARHGTRFASRKRRQDPRPDAAVWLATMDESDGEALLVTLPEYFERYQFLGVIPAVPAALLAWLRREWPLTLCEGIPSPLKVLHMQVAGARPVTLVGDWPRMIQPVLTKADGFAFMVHDLEHAWKFFHDDTSHLGQRRFFGLMLAAVEQGYFRPYCAEERFASQFDYLISDMNTHVVHGLRYLVAILIECLLRREGKTMQATLSAEAEFELVGLLEDLAALWKFSVISRDALLGLLSGEFGAARAGCLERAILAGRNPHG